MSLVAYVVVLAFTGLVVGGLGRLVLPRRDAIAAPLTPPPVPLR